jgi:hypothetical protein
MKKILKPRAIKRLIEKEKAQLNLRYQKLRADFLMELFSDFTSEEDTYNTILDRFCRLWKKICREMSSKLKVIVPNLDCFYNEFQPAI